MSRHHWSREENEVILLCYYSANPNVRGYRRRMFQLWKERYPESTFAEQRIADRALYLLRSKKFTDLEIERIQRLAQSPDVTTLVLAPSVPQGVGENTPGQVLRSSINEPLLTDIDNSIVDASSLSSSQLLMKDKIESLLHSGVERRRLPKLKYCKALKDYIFDANQVVRCISTSCISETVELMYAVACTITEHMGCSARPFNSPLSSSPPAWDKRLVSKLCRL